MMKKVLKCLGLAAVVLPVIAVSVLRMPPVKKETTRWPVMGTVAQVTMRGSEAQILEAKFGFLPIVKESYEKVNSLLSAWNPDSELSRLAASGCTNWVERASPLVKPCYAAALKLSRESGGAFNPFVGAKLRELGVSGGSNYSSFDLGAIAKGFAVDAAAKEILRIGKTHHIDMLLDLGGNLRVVGNGIWRTGIRNPFDKAGDFAGIIALTNGESVATSGNYERFIERDGVRFSHILDGRTGEPTGGIAAVTVITPQDYGAVLADGLSTTLFILGPSAGTDFLKRHYPRALALWIPDTPSTPRIIATKEMALRLSDHWVLVIGGW